MNDVCQGIDVERRRPRLRRVAAFKNVGSPELLHRQLPCAVSLRAANGGFYIFLGFTFIPV